MPDNLQLQGVKLVVEGESESAKALKRLEELNDRVKASLERQAQAEREAAKADEELTRARESLAKANQELQGAIASQNSSLSQAVPAISSATSATSGLTAASVALTGAVAAAAAAIAVIGAAIAGAGAAINTALNFGDAIHDIQAVTGTSAQMAQSIYGAARVSGTSVSSVTGAFAGLNERIDKTEQRAGVALGKVTNAANDAAKRMARLNEDYAQSVSDINEQLAERLAAINEQRVEAEQRLTERLARLNEDYNRTVADGRAQLTQRLSDLDESHGERVASINERIASEVEDVAGRRVDIERSLNEKISDLNYDRQKDIERIQTDGVQDQTRLQEGLQRELASIEQKYASQRQSLQDKIYNPSTNPILRAYYKTQLKSLNDQQKNERSAAEASYRAKADQARRETQIAIDAVNERTERELAIERAAAARKLAEINADSAKRLAALQAQIAKEDAEYAKQTERLRAEQARREADSRASYERQVADTRAAYDKQIEAAAAAQLKIEAETAKRLEREKQQYDRSAQDIADSLDKALSAGGGGGGVAKAIDPIADAFDRLGIKVSDFQKLSPDEQFNVLNQAVGKLISEGKLQEAFDILSQLFGPAMAGQMLEFFKEAQTLRDLGFTQEQIDQLVAFRKKTNEVGLQLEILVAQVGTDLLPIVEEMIAGFQRFWKEHGPEITRVIREIARFITGQLVPAIRDIWDWITTKFIPGIQSATTEVGTAFKRSLDSVTFAFNRDFGPAINTVKEFIGNLITKVGEAGTALGTLATDISTRVSGAFDGAKTAVEGFLGGIRDIYNFVTSTFNGAIQSLQERLSGLRPPSVFTPGSPTPFEMGLRGIHDAMQQINRTGLPAINASAGVEAALAGGARVPYGMATAATPGQMAAKTINQNSSVDNRMAKVTINVGAGADRTAVSDGVYDGLYRAGFVMVS